jgi:hypothetical protein
MSLHSVKLERLQCAFPKLTEANQYYVLGLAEGLIHAQSAKVAEQRKKAKLELGKNGRMRRDK